MAKPDKQGRLAARARERFDTALSRRRYRDAAEALLALPSAERSFGLEALSAVAAPEIDQAFARRDQAGVLPWLRFIEREPRLLSTLSARTRYALFAIALGARMWPRAQALWGDVRPSVPSPALVSAVDALVAAQGEPDPAALADVVADATRLGYQGARTRSEHPVPKQSSEVDDACLRCFGAETWPRYRDTVTTWLANATPDIARRVRFLSAQLSERELWLRSRSGGSTAAEVAGCIAGWARAADAPAELETLIGHCLRISARAAAAASGNATPVLTALQRVAELACNYPSLKPLVATAVLQAHRETAAPALHRDLLRVAVAAQPSLPALIEIAVALHVKELHSAAHGGDADWFNQAVEAALATPAELARALEHETQDDAASSTRLHKENPCAEPCHALLEALPVALAANTVERLWDHADTRLRERLSAASPLILDRMVQTTSAGGTPGLNSFRRLLQQFDPELAHSMNDTQLRGMLRSAQGQELIQHLELAESRLGQVMPQHEHAARQLLDRVVPHSVEALEFALERTTDKAEARRLARAHLSNTTTLLERMLRLAHANHTDCIEACDALEPYCFANLTPQAADAAAALMYAERVGMPRRLRNRCARALLDALEREPQAVEDPKIARAAALALRRTRPASRKPKRKARSAKKPATTETSPAAVGGEHTKRRRAASTASEQVAEIARQLGLPEVTHADR